MSDYFFNLSDFCNFALPREKQTPVKKVVFVYAFGCADFVCREFYRNIYGSNIACQSVIAFSVNNRRNSGSNSYARIKSFLLKHNKGGQNVTAQKIIFVKFYTMP